MGMTIVLVRSLACAEGGGPSFHLEYMSGGLQCGEQGPCLPAAVASAAQIPAHVGPEALVEFKTNKEILQFVQE